METGRRRRWLLHSPDHFQLCQSPGQVKKKKKPLIAHLTAFKGFTSLPLLKVRVWQHGQQGSSGYRPLNKNSSCSQTIRGLLESCTAAVTEGHDETLSFSLPNAHPHPSPPLGHQRGSLQLSRAGSSPLQSQTQSKSCTVSFKFLTSWRHLGQTGGPNMQTQLTTKVKRGKGKTNWKWHKMRLWWRDEKLQRRE